MNVLFSCHVRKVRRAGAAPPSRGDGVGFRGPYIAGTAVKRDRSSQLSDTECRPPMLGPGAVAKAAVAAGGRKWTYLVLGGFLPVFQNW